MSTHADAMAKAVRRLEEISANENVRRRYEARQQRMREELARSQASKDKGIVEGEKKKAIEIARNLFEMGLSVEQVAEAVELPLEEVENLINCNVAQCRN